MKRCGALAALVSGLALGGAGCASGGSMAAASVGSDPAATRQGDDAGAAPSAADADIPGRTTQAGAGASDSGPSAGDATDASSEAPPASCAPMPPSTQMLAGGYYVSGPLICDAMGRPHWFHGVDRPSLEWSSKGQNLSAADYQLMATSWKANVVRIALNEDFWLKSDAAGASNPSYDPSYAGTVDQQVKWAESAGLDVILDLHWSDRGDFSVGQACVQSSGNCQQCMADSHSVEFWKEVAGVYKNDPRVVYELYNEPHDVPWSSWLSAGPSADPTGSVTCKDMSGQQVAFTTAGMQDLYDAVRQAGANNPVIVGGLKWAFDLSGVPTHRVQGYNIVYNTHPYSTATHGPPSLWDSGFGFLTTTDAVIATEFGDAQTCETSTNYSYYSQLIQYADAHHMSWTGWAWFQASCTFPSLIADWSGTPTGSSGAPGPGLIEQAALLSY